MPITYRKDDMRAAAAARGWNLKQWCKAARINYWTGHSFMRGKSNSPGVAEALTKAVGGRPGSYQLRDSKRAVA